MSAGRLRISRKVGEALYIGPDVCVRVVEARGSNVRLEILAPSSCKVWREELVDGAFLEEFGRQLREAPRGIDVTGLLSEGVTVLIDQPAGGGGSGRMAMAPGPITFSASPGGAGSIKKTEGGE